MYTMKNWIPFLVICTSILSLWNCSERDSLTSLPPCIEQKVQEYKEASACGIDSARVTRYHSQIGYVYLFSYDYCCCDYASPVLDEDCNEVCFFGGFAGVTKCMVDSVELQLKDPVVIWEK